jgi:hypothetical protein
VNDDEIVAALRASRRRSAVELAELLDGLTSGGLSAGALIMYFKRAFPRIPLRTLQDAGAWTRVCRGHDVLSDEGFNDLLRKWLEDGSEGPHAWSPADGTSVAGEASRPLTESQAKILQAAGDALDAERQGRAPTTPCPVCGTVLRVESLPEIGVTHVRCGSGCTTFRMSYRSRSSGES